MTCPICGRTTSNENANFCENCGASFRNIDSTPIDSLKTNLDIPDTKKEEQKTISFRTFLGIMLLPLIPMFGPFIYLAILLTWSFGKQFSDTQKNYARATLVFLIISVLFVIYAISSGIVAVPLV